MKKAIILALSIAAAALFWSQGGIPATQAGDASLAQITFYVH